MVSRDQAHRKNQLLALSLAHRAEQVVRSCPCVLQCREDEERSARLLSSSSCHAFVTDGWLGMAP
jgi:hypothetical protein